MLEHRRWDLLNPVIGEDDCYRFVFLDSMGCGSLPAARFRALSGGLWSWVWTRWFGKDGECLLSTTVKGQFTRYVIVYMHGAAFRVQVIGFLCPTPAFVFCIALSINGKYPTGEN